MKYIQCPDDYNQIYNSNIVGVHQQSLFLAGGITGCGDWQSDVASKLTGKYLIVVNPRRKVWDDKITTLEQVTWEFEAISRCKNILFWFTPPTMNPITLLEYGKVLENREQFHGHNIFVGCHPDYVRREDVIVQTKLARPKSKIKVYDNLDEMIKVINDKFR